MSFMKAFTLILILLLSLQASAQTFYQVNNTHSFASSSKMIQNLSGLINLQDKFSDSKIELNGPNLSFRTLEISGEMADFELKGELEENGSRQEVTLRGKIIQGSQGRVALRASSNNIALHILASLPEDNRNGIFKEVQDIIQ